MLQRLRELVDTREIAERWQSVYTGISVISNRITPSHRDRKGRPQWFDSLISYSDPSNGPQLLLNELGLELEYSSGTVVGLCGTVLKHEVRSWGDGDRVCYAHFMREEVRRKLGAPIAGWVNRRVYLPESDIEVTENGDDDMEWDGELENNEDDMELDNEATDYSDDDMELD